MKSGVRALLSLTAKNKFLVFFDCGHRIVIDATVDDPAGFDRKARVVCLECERIGNHYDYEFDGEG